MYNVAIYIRLSKEDIDRGFDESESIAYRLCTRLRYRI